MSKEIFNTGAVSVGDDGDFVWGKEIAAFLEGCTPAGGTGEEFFGNPRPYFLVILIKLSLSERVCVGNNGVPVVTFSGGPSAFVRVLTC